MNQEFALYLLTRCVNTALLIAGPVLLVGLVIGLSVSIFQSATQISEATLTFIPKIMAIMAVLILGLPWMLQQIISFTQEIFSIIATLSVSGG